MAVPGVGSGIRTPDGCPRGGKWDSNPHLPVIGSDYFDNKIFNGAAIIRYASADADRTPSHEVYR